MVKARLINLSGGRLTVEFEGDFCHTCSFYDYFEDLIYEMGAEEELKRVSVEQVAGDRFRAVYRKTEE